MKDGIIRRWREYLPKIDEKYIVSLGEGDTPLVRMYAVERALYQRFETEIEAYALLEGLNPTCSFKDRGMTLAISMAWQEGVNDVICASTGNTSASLSAYAARAGMKAEVWIPRGGIALGKLVQARIHGARVREIEGNFDMALEHAREIVEKNPGTKLMNSSNPHRIEGQKTAAFEICETLRKLGKPLPVAHCLPVGNGGNITAYWKGYQQWLEPHGKKEILYPHYAPPKMFGFQADGSAPLVYGGVVKNPKTVASAIRIGNPVHRENALAAAQESGGMIKSCLESEILDAYAYLAQREGIFCEPASAISVAGLFKGVKLGRMTFKKGDVVVCTLTGNGLKDPDTAKRMWRKRWPQFA